jgi:hypothetical protein
MGASGTHMLWLKVVDVDTEDMVVVNALTKSGDGGTVLVFGDTSALQDDTFASTKI